MFDNKERVLKGYRIAEQSATKSNSFR